MARAFTRPKFQFSLGFVLVAFVVLAVCIVLRESVLSFLSVRQISNTIGDATSQDYVESMQLGMVLSFSYPDIDQLLNTNSHYLDSKLLQTSLCDFCKSTNAKVRRRSLYAIAKIVKLVADPKHIDIGCFLSVVKTIEESDADNHVRLEAQDAIFMLERIQRQRSRR